MTLREVADAAGMDPGHLSKVERDEAGVSGASLQRLIVVLHLRPRELAELLAEQVTA